MEHLKLTDDLRTNIVEIDNQHRELFARGNLILFPEGGKPSNLDVAGALLFLMDYVDKHFSAEEQLMEYYDYKRLEGHRKQHQRLRNDVKEIYRRSENKSTLEGLANELYYLLSDWFVYHIKEWDKSFTVFLKETIGPEEILLPGFKDVDGGSVNVLKSEAQLTSAQLITLNKLRNE